MPIYEYECRKCKAHTEAFQKVTDKPLTKCPKCGGRLDKRISAPAIQFKGSGWYVTDYGKATKDSKSESETQTTKSGKPEKSETSEKSDHKSTKESSSAKKTDKPSAPKASSSD
jgi:putative FmdB family regulatory protein